MVTSEEQTLSEKESVRLKDLSLEARIPVLLERLFHHWKKHPDQRLIQLLHNLLPARFDPYYTEDQEVLDMMDASDTLDTIIERVRKREEEEKKVTN